ncbi:MAG: glycosyltransferase, partial [Gemmatimonadota bacterium]|nr:glycosyltransferase [Gemmatimonadota bacterium]
ASPSPGELVLPSTGGRRSRGHRAAGTAEYPLVSVVTVVHNRASQIESTILGVLEQTYPHIEYIVIDGGSTDGTVDVIRRYDDRIDYWASEPDGGIYHAMNKAIDLVLDPDAYVLFANSDDRLYTNDALARLVAGGKGADLVYGRMVLGDGEVSAVHGREVELNDLAGETLCHPATLTRRNVFDEVGKFDTSFRIAADYDFLVRCFAHPVTTRYVPEIVSRMAMGGMSEDQYILSCRERKRVVRTRFSSVTRLVGVWRVNLYDIPRHTARDWLSRAGLLGYWRALKRL